jgi:hypothetical protein
VIMCRVSSDEKGDTLEGQLAPTFALCEHHELKVRLVILAEGMSGTRAVRADRELATPTDLPMRDDIHMLDWLVEYEGWPMNVVLRSPDRIARERLAMETILNRWKRYGLALWIAEYGREVGYDVDALLLGAQNLVASTEAQNIAKRTRSGAVRKGPLSGKGWLGSTKFGFIRDEEKNLLPDQEQWPFILRAFELADVGLDGKALSTREVAEALATEGCTFDHDRVRTLLQDPIYVTGEFTVKVDGAEVAQTPVKLEEPVPIDRFERVQQKLKARKGSTKRTRAGEFALNCIELVHQRCLDDCEDDEDPPRIRGYNLAKAPDRKVYRHHPKVPETCKKMTWERDEIEKPVIVFLRQLAEDPELVAALSAAAAPTIAATSTRLTDEQRLALTQEIETLEQEKNDLASQLAENVARGVSSDPGAYRDLTKGIDKAIESRNARLERDDIAREREGQDAKRGLGAALLDALPVETPDDDEAILLRARIIEECISRVVIDDSNPEELKLTIYGPLIPEGSVADGVDPVTRAARLLHQTSFTPPAQTDLSAKDDKSVCASGHRPRATQSDTGLDRQRRRDGCPAWEKVVRVPKEKAS